MESWGWLLVLAMILMWWDIRRWATRVERRFRWMQSHMIELSEQAGTEFDPVGWVPRKIVDLVHRGEVVKAIKELRRNELGLSLAEARQVVETIAARRPDWWPAQRVEDPESLPPEDQDGQHTRRH